MSQRVLLIEDNADLAFGLQRSLEVEGYDVVIAADGLTGIDMVRKGSVDLILLDLMLPDLSGYEVLRRIRHEEYNMPVLILTARGEEVDKVQGFRLGADDYVVKPVGVLELLARVEAILRRSAATAVAEPILECGDLSIDLAKRAVTIGNSTVEMSPMEYDLLATLARRGGELATRRDLLREVWGYRASIETRTVDTHIAKLRAKLEESTARIVTVRKKGYRLE